MEANDRKKTLRESNIELLRIVSMILIVMHHYCVHGNFSFGEGISINQYMIQALSIGGKIGVNLFVLITGYFMIHSKFKLKKLIKLVLEITTYSIIFMFVGCVWKTNQINIRIVLKSLLPIIYGLYWFPTTYVLLYILSPFINKFVKNVDKKTVINLLLVLLIMQVMIPTFMGASLNFSNLIWFMTLYLIGAYIRLYGIHFLDNKGRNILIMVVNIFVILFSILVIDIVAQKIPKLSQYALYFAGINKLPAVIISITMFYLFKDIKIRESKIINTIAASTFGVYLIHDHVVIRTIIWEDLLKVNWVQDSPYLLIHLFSSVILVFFIATGIDILRKYTIEKVLLKLLDKMQEKYKGKYEKLKGKVNELIRIQC